MTNRKASPLTTITLSLASMIAGALAGGATMYNRLQQLHADHAATGNEYISERKTNYEQNAIEKIQQAKQHADKYILDADQYIIDHKKAYTQGVLDGIKQAKEIIQEEIKGYKK